MTDREILGRVRYFHSLPATEIRWLAQQCKPRQLHPGNVLFEEGESCRGLYIIGEGSVEVRQVSFGGREQVLHTEGPGATLGEAPLFDRQAYVASAVAVEPTQVLFLPRAALLRLCHRRPSVALSILETLARRVRHFATMVGDLSFRPVTERLGRYISAALTEHRASDRLEVNLKLTQAQLAARLGTVREMVARAFSQLERAGIIARKRSRIVIRDPERLAALVRGQL